MSVIRKLNIKDVKEDENLKADDGWVRMHVQWLCTEKTMGSQSVVLGRTVFEPGGAAHELHTHSNAEEVLYVIEGQGMAISGDEEFEIGPGDVVFVPYGEKHFFKNTHDTKNLETIWIYGGAPSLEKAGYEPE